MTSISGHSRKSGTAGDQTDFINSIHAISCRSLTAFAQANFRNPSFRLSVSDISPRLIDWLEFDSGLRHKDSVPEAVPYFHKDV